MATRQLRILQILRAPIGGLYRHVVDLSAELVQRGHLVGLVTDSLTADAQTDERLKVLGESLALGVHRFPMPRLFGAADAVTPFRIRSLAGRLEADVLHGHGAKGALNARLARLGASRRVALYTPHGGVLNYSPESMTGKLLRRIEAALLPLTDALIFESAFARDAFFAQIGTPKCPAPVIHNGLRAQEFEPVPPGPEACDFVYVGELRPVKGVSVLLEALVEVRRPDGTPATLIIAGGGPLESEVRAQVSRLGLDERVTLAGVQPARAMFALGHVAVVPSLAESLPYIVMEAAAAQLPVISTRVGGIAEYFGPTADNLLPAGDAAALRTTMQAALDAPDTARTEMLARLAHVRESFAVARMADAIEALYIKVLDRP